MHSGHTSIRKVYAGIGRKILSQVKQQYAPWFSCMHPAGDLTDFHVFPSALVSIVQKSGDKGQNENLYSGQFPDTDAWRIRFEDVYSM